MNPVVSIIIPVHNVAGSIGRCLSSILAQTYSSLEVILVDDHGIDGSISAAHGITDSCKGPVRFVYAQTPANSGPGAARNVGIDLSTGKYLAFVDGDDSIAPNFCELLVDSAERNGSDLCYCNIDLLNENGDLIETKRNAPFEDGEFCGKVRKDFLVSYVTYFTTFLYKRTLFEQNGIHFPQGRMAEDSAMLCCALLCSRRISRVEASLYRYYRHRDSLTTSRDGTRYLQRLTSMDAMLDTVRVNNWYDADKDEIEYIYIKKGYLMSVVDCIAMNHRVAAEDIDEIRSRVLEKIPLYKSNPYLKRHLPYRLMDMMISVCPSIAIKVICLYVAIWRKSCQ